MNTESNRSEVIDHAKGDYEEVQQEDSTQVVQHKASGHVPLLIDFLSLGSSNNPHSHYSLIKPH